jgi:hypothetical protein
MPQPALTLENSVRAVRILHAVILYSMILFILMAEDFLHHEPHKVHLIWIGFLVTGLMVVGVAISFRLRTLQPAAEVLQTSPDDRMALSRWRFGNILSFVLAESIVLLGFALRFLGGTITQSLPFYIVGLALMLVWWPGRP